MTHEEFQAAFNYLVEIEWVYLPYSLLPGSAPGTLRELLTEEAWNAYEWNPPQYLKHLLEYSDQDPIASPKPDWSVLVAALAPAMERVMRPAFILDVKQECTRRISAAYGENNVQNEIFLRLRNEHTSEQDAERERLRTKSKSIILSLEDMDYEALKTFDPTDDMMWEPDD